MKFFILMILASNAIANFNFHKDLSLREINLDEFSEKLTQKFFEADLWPDSLDFNEKEYDLDYTINKKLTKYVNRELRRYRSDYASVVVIDNNTGEVITATDYTRKTRKFSKNLAFSTSNPAASIFKVITAADLLENSDVNKNTKFSYNGRGTTLYKYQLRNKKNRWTRTIPLKKAFAISNNVVFGKAAIKNTNHKSLRKTATKFGFNNTSLVQLLSVGSSELFINDKEYGLAEFASGFNRKTIMSPIHGAIIASVIANGGVYRKPTLISKVTESGTDREIWHASYEGSRVISESSASEMKSMMELTVKRGTARGAFRPWKTKRIKNIRIGGKTGSITGGMPHGKRDWFVSYAMPQSLEDKGISVCVMIVNVNKWYIKSSYLAKNVIEYYYSKLNKQ